MRVRDVPPEALLTRAGRAQLPLRGQIWLYFYPFPLFRDARAEDVYLREAGLRYNRERAHVLVAYLMRWTALVVLHAAGCLLFESVAATHPAYAALTMLCGLATACSVSTLFLLGVCYLVLVSVPDASGRRSK